MFIYIIKNNTRDYKKLIEKREKKSTKLKYYIK